ncbi:hypothetical protein NUW58_g4156 [Xylaria curta]|uniref:Uncharacterized protein n=1 Tax=Xylaria curta TaxID=42375 RepID=A0ACC1PAP4_9PEZI|nr:hypothetical protein NUW58_g4156 [Xylaria curta]
MDGTHRIQPLTEENLRVYQDERPLSPSETSTDYLPIDRLERAKRRVYNFLMKLKRIGDEGERIRDMVDVYISRELEVGYRGNNVPEPDLRDPSFWEAKFESLIQEHALAVEVARLKRSVCELMATIRNCGREGHKFLADYELHAVSKYDVCYRGNSDPNPDMNDPAYLEAQREYLNDKRKSLSDANFKRFPRYRLPSPMMREVLEKNKPGSKPSGPSFERHRKRVEVEVWTHKNYVEPKISEPCSTVFSDSPERTTAGSVEESNGNRPELTRSFRWGEAYRGVYKRMTALWHLGGEGRELVENDELCVAGKYEVRYRRSRGPKPDLKDPSYWEAKWQYFTEKYISLLRGMEDNTQLLQELTLDSWEIPVPDPASYNSSTTASLVEPLDPSPESFWANTMKLLKLSLYKVMSRDFFKNEGRQILENDELYIAGRKSGYAADVGHGEFIDYLLR